MSSNSKLDDFINQFAHFLVHSLVVAIFVCLLNTSNFRHEAIIRILVSQEGLTRFILSIDLILYFFLCQRPFVHMRIRSYSSDWRGNRLGCLYWVQRTRQSSEFLLVPIWWLTNGIDPCHRLGLLNSWRWVLGEVVNSFSLINLIYEWGMILSLVFLRS